MNKDLAQKILNYLATKPYQEVYQLVNEIIQESNKKAENEKAMKEIIEKSNNEKVVKK
jgi:hypothetical protein